MSIFKCSSTVPCLANLGRLEDASFSYCVGNSPIDGSDASHADHVIDSLLHWVEAEFFGMYGILRQLDQRDSKCFVLVGPSDHHLIQKSVQASIAVCASLEAEVLLEDVKGACMTHSQELEVWKKLFQSVLDGSARNGPPVLSHKSSAGNGCLRSVIFDSLSFCGSY
jgi:hypothetical protein